MAYNIPTGFFENGEIVESFSKSEGAKARCRLVTVQSNSEVKIKVGQSFKIVSIIYQDYETVDENGKTFAYPQSIFLPNEPID